MQLSCLLVSLIPCLLPIGKAHILELYLMFEAWQTFRTCHLLDGVLCHQDLIDTFHRGQTLGDVIACFREVLQRIDDGVEHHHVVDEDRTGKRVVIKNEYTTEP